MVRGSGDAFAGLFGGGAAETEIIGFTGWRNHVKRKAEREEAQA